MKKIVNIIYLIVLQVFILFCAFCMFETSDSNITKLGTIKIDIIIINLSILFLLVSFFIAIGIKETISNFIFLTLSLLLSIINYYTIRFHGMPLTFAELRNAKTAFNVIGNYKFECSSSLILILKFYLVALFCTFFLLKRKYNTLLYFHLSKKNRLIKWLCFGSMLILLMCLFMFPTKYNKMFEVKWSWREKYTVYGYCPCTISSFIHSFHIADKPKGYSSEVVKQILNNTKENKDETKEEKPDIILILNETFFDLNQVTNLESDIDPLGNFSISENRVKGYAVVPCIGGGTNSSEYEMLTSNLLEMMGNITPFNVLNMKDANSIVDFLKNKGYATLAAHPNYGSNYSRTNGYAGLGFEKIHFIQDFHMEYYGDRKSFDTDSAAYNDLNQWYSSMSDGPRFLYLLTMQNHGAWNVNQAKYDLVHVKNNFSKNQNQVNEYLSCISLSDMALDNLFEYYKKINRKVIICMIGDHAPSFVTEVTDNNFTNEEIEVRQRSVPFVIWSNYGIESENLGTISMVYVVPILLEKAKIILSPYYQYLLDLKNKIPILTSYGVYLDNDFEHFEYDSSSQYSEQIAGYQFLEYNRVFDTRNHIDEINFSK